jgi:hypothetical protein
MVTVKNYSLFGVAKKLLQASIVVAIVEEIEIVPFFWDERDYTYYLGHDAHGFIISRFW